MTLVKESARIAMRKLSKIIVKKNWFRNHTNQTIMIIVFESIGYFS